jgi:hypothetical protein
MNISLSDSEQILTHEEVSHFESTIKLKLPEVFKSFYLKYNGGFPDKEFFEGWCVYFFYSIKYGNKPNTIDNNINYDTIPKGFLPFAETPTDSETYCLDLNEGENYGKVYFLSESGDDPVFITNSFEELIESLTEEDI